MRSRCLRLTLLALAAAWLAPAAFSQNIPSQDEIPIERCDRLPVVKAEVAGKTMRFLVDTAATTVLNLKSFSGGHSKEIQITSWSGTAATSAREVSISDLASGVITCAT